MGWKTDFKACFLHNRTAVYNSSCQKMPRFSNDLKVCTEPVATWPRVTQSLNAVIESDVLARNKMFDDLIHQVSPDRYWIDKCYH